MYDLCNAWAINVTKVISKLLREWSDLIEQFKRLNPLIFDWTSRRMNHKLLNMRIILLKGSNFTHSSMQNSIWWNFTFMNRSNVITLTGRYICVCAQQELTLKSIITHIEETSNTTINNNNNNTSTHAHTNIIYIYTPGGEHHKRKTKIKIETTKRHKNKMTTTGEVSAEGSRADRLVRWCSVLKWEAATTERRVARNERCTIYSWWMREIIISWLDNSFSTSIK